MLAGRTRRWLWLLATAVAPVLAMVPAGGCVKNEATGKRIFAYMSREDEVALGAKAAPEFTQEFGGAVPNDRLQGYVRDIGLKLSKETEAANPTLPWEFTLLNTDVVNAFALPGGKVFFTRGLAAKLTNEAQMAGVIGHEIGHVTAQHGNQRMSSAGVLNIILAGAAIGVGAAPEDSSLRKYGQYSLPAIQVGGTLVLLKFGRAEELEADRLGVRYMSNVGYDPKGQLQVMQVLASLSQGSSTPAILATHPDPQARIDQIQGLLAGEYAHTQRDPKYQLFPDRYQAQFLSVLKTVPPAPKPQPQPQQGRADDRSMPDDDELAVRAALGDPSEWCAVCAR